MEDQTKSTPTLAFTISGLAICMPSAQPGEGSCISEFIELWKNGPFAAP
jgi:hypothetical protein